MQNGIKISKFEKLSVLEILMPSYIIKKNLKKFKKVIACSFKVLFSPTIILRNM